MRLYALCVTPFKIGAEFPMRSRLYVFFFLETKNQKSETKLHGMSGDRLPVAIAVVGFRLYYLVYEQ